MSDLKITDKTIPFPLRDGKSTPSDRSSAPFRSPNDPTTDIKQKITPLAAKLNRQLASQELAQAERKREEKLQAADVLLAAMREKLGRIVKNYPPFSADSPERAELLRSFIGLRKQIEQLTIRPAGEENLELKQQSVLPLLDEIPQLTEEAADKDIEAALVTIEKTEERLRKAASSSQADSAEEASTNVPVKLIQWLTEQGIDVVLLDEERADRVSLTAKSALSGSAAQITATVDFTFLLR